MQPIVISWHTGINCQVIMWQKMQEEGVTFHLFNNLLDHYTNAQKKLVVSRLIWLIKKIKKDKTKAGGQILHKDIYNN